MSQLLEHILNGNYVSANDLFEKRMVEIQEQKLYESKRMIQAEALGGETPAQRAAKEKAGYVRASAPIEKGGLGLSSYDVAQQKKKERLAGRKSGKPDQTKEVPREMPRPVSKTQKDTSDKWADFTKQYTRKGEMEKKRAEFLKKRPVLRAGIAASKITKSIANVGSKALDIKRKVDSGAGSIASHFGSSAI